ncbi:MAG TPA: thioesterase family protein [Pirellulales bacterium]|jgi:4-hydroxybenzoyl-CoA thioesterase/acyl-CoA thioester hydrolase|nr:thioesterase family protein [Pirellulales bacterium]
MSEPYRTTRRVEFRDTDAAGIAHFSAFFFYMESVEHEFLRHLGLSVLSKALDETKKTFDPLEIPEADKKYLAGVKAQFENEIGDSEDCPISWPRVSASCDYQSAVRFEDMLDIELRIARLGTKSVSYEFVFASAGRQVATGRTVAVCCRFPAGAPPESIPIPAPIVAKLQPFAS